MHRHPFYGTETLARPLVCNIPVAPPQAELSACPYCGEPCWVMPMELRVAKILPAHWTFTSACTECAFARASHQRVMDMARWAKENAEACAAERTVGSDYSGGRRG